MLEDPANDVGRKHCTRGVAGTGLTVVAIGPNLKEPEGDRIEVGKNCKRIRILHIFRALHPGSGGPLTHLESVVKALDHDRFENRIATLEPCQPPRSVPKPAYSGAVGQRKLLQVLRFAWWLRNAIAEADVIQIHGVFGWQLALGGVLSRVAGVPYLVRPHGSLSPWFLGHEALKKRLFLFFIGAPILRRSRGLIAMSRMEAESFRALNKRFPVVEITPGVEIPALRASRKGDHSLRIVFLGRIAPLKNIPDLLAAVASIKARGHKVNLDMIGDGPGNYPSRMRSLVRSLGISDEVIFHGYLSGEEKWSVMRMSHVFALPSNYENFSHVTAEALALGLPAVITDTVALAPHVRQYSCGVVVPLGDVAALADALLQFSDDGNWQSASDAARRCAKEHLSPQGMRESLERLYEEARH